MRRPDRADLLFAVTAAAAAAVLLALGAGLTFFSDEWAFIESRALADPTTWFEPHNEHWTTLAILLYRGLVETVGLGSYMPYLAVLVAVHVTVASLAYLIVRWTSGRWVAVAVGTVVLLLGGGFENLFWGFQIAFIGSLALGLGAMLAFDARPLTLRRKVAGTSLLAASLATSGIGLVCTVAIGVELLLDPDRRRTVAWLLIPMSLYGGWYLAIGRVGVEAHRGLFDLGGPEEILPIVVTGLAAATGALTGVGTELGRLMLALASGGVVIRFLRRRRFGFHPRTVGCVVAIVLLYGLIGLTRSFVGPGVSDLPRYTYVSTIFLAIAICAQAGRPRPDSRTNRMTWLLVGGLVFSLSLPWNVRLLIAGRALFQERAERTRALVTVALERPLPASTDPDRTLVLVPSPNALQAIVAAHGSPLDDWIVPWAVPPVDAVQLDAARSVLAEGAEIPLPRGPDQSP